MKKVHEIHGMISEDGNDITSYVHERHRIGECPWCDFIRVENITREFLDRLDRLSSPVDNLYMWSLGTSLTDTVMNRKLIQRRWHEFQKRMYRVEKWKPLFRVLEVGMRGFLHFHVIVECFCEHRAVLNMWRSLTREQSNVHVSGHRGKQDPKRLTRYLLKYLTKSSSKYSWLGRFHGMGSRTSRRVSNWDSSVCERYGGLTCYEFVTEAYQKYDRQHKID